MHFRIEESLQAVDTRHDGPMTKVNMAGAQIDPLMKPVTQAETRHCRGYEWSFSRRLAFSLCDRRLRFR